jgi:hypothetical protein
MFIPESGKPSQQAAPVVQDRDITLNRYADRWLEQIASSVDERAADGYCDTLRLRIRPVLGTVMLRGLLRGHFKARDDGVGMMPIMPAPA